MSADREAELKAAEFRQDHGLEQQPLGDLVTIIEQATGYDVAVLEAPPDQHGLTMRDPKRGAVFIGVAATKHPMRQRSSLAHELGHVLFGDWVPLGDECGGEIERRADAFARHLLLPAKGVSDFVGTLAGADEALVAAVVQRYLVSPHMAAISLARARLIEQSTIPDWKATTTWQLAIRFGWQAQYESMQCDSQRLRAPQGLLTRANRAYAAGVLSAQAIASLRGVSLAKAEEDLVEAGIQPTNDEPDDLDLSELPLADIDLSDLPLPEDGDD